MRHETRRLKTRWLLAVLMCSLSSVAHATAQASSDSTCYYSDKPGKTLSFALPAGYRAELRRDADSATVEWPCTVAVRNSRDSIVWGARGFGTTIVPWTGHDVDGDGTPDAILGVDTGGGNRCCWGYYVLRLTPKVGVIVELEGHTWFGNDERGRTLVWTTVPFYDLGPNMAESPTVVLTSQFRGRKLQDITLERCPRILHDTLPVFESRRWEWDSATPAMRAVSRQATAESYEVEETRNAVTSLVLQHLACGLPTEAKKLVDETWPAAEAPAQLERLRGAWATHAPSKK